MQEALTFRAQTGVVGVRLEEGAQVAPCEGAVGFLGGQLGEGLAGGAVLGILREEALVGFAGLGAIARFEVEPGAGFERGLLPFGGKRREQPQRLVG
ncbi:hypothetical protein D3C87_1980870 [compost metagenome]